MTAIGIEVTLSVFSSVNDLYACQALDVVSNSMCNTKLMLLIASLIRNAGTYTDEGIDEMLRQSGLSKEVLAEQNVKA